MFSYITSIMWGILVGFAVAVPIGPVGLICIQRTITKNKLSGLISGLGAAVADVLLASVGAFSITIIFSFIKEEQVVLRFIGGLILLIIGIVSIMSKKNVEEFKKETTLSAIEEFLSGFILTITNPLSAFVFFLAFAETSSRIGSGINIAFSFVIGIFIGSCLWWLFLTYIADKIAHKIKHEYIKVINKCFAIAITALGIIIILRVLI